ncbi:hypothetical protein MPY17_14030 [Rhodococcus opacus]|uniref:hypothetical protein n=1 Tax=Rhodococcus opacus TaxID=37919 RepID=UPI001FF0F4A1|nr:hypothetical protein [Rhodococcus opacus]UOT06787.1 hypothetical protein MPY17_14030 [Rhodococcus opacus]
MAYEDLLPTGADVVEDLTKAELTTDQIHSVLQCVSRWLDEHAEYYRVQHNMHGEKSDDGAGTAIASLASDLADNIRYQ